MFRSDGDLSRLPLVISGSNRLGNEARQRMTVVLRDGFPAAIALIATPLPIKHGSSMRVRSGDHHIRGGNAGPFFDELSRFDHDPFRHRDQITYYDSGPSGAVIQNRCLRGNIVEHAFVAAFMIITREPDADGWIDLH